MRHGKVAKVNLIQMNSYTCDTHDKNQFNWGKPEGAPHFCSETALKRYICMCICWFAYSQARPTMINNLTSQSKDLLNYQIKLNSSREANYSISLAMHLFTSTVLFSKPRVWWR